MTQKWQHREQQLQQLRFVLKCTDVPDILVHGPSCTGKTSIVRELLAGRPHGYISCSRNLKLRSVLSSTLSQIAQGTKRKHSQAFAAASGSENSLIWELKAACSLDQPSKILVLDDVQQLLMAPEGPLPALLALRDQAGVNIALVLISKAQPAALGLLGVLRGMVVVAFPAYTEPELVSILALMGPPQVSGDSNGACSSSQPQQQQQHGQQRRQEEQIDKNLQHLYKRFISTVVVPNFQRLSRCLPDLASQATALWPKYLAAARQQQQGQQQQQPMQEDQEDAEVDQESRLYTVVRPKLQAALGSFQPAACCMLVSLHSSNKVAAGQQQQQQWQQSVGMSGAHMAAELELPRVGKLLLIAAFLASRNKRSVDKQLFESVGGWRRKGGGRRKTVMGADRQAEAAKAAQLKGPHTFSLARLLAVYANLLAADDDHIGSIGGGGAWQPQQQGLGGTSKGTWLGVETTEVMLGVNSLVAVRLMSQACDDLLEGSRFACEAPQELVERVALDMGVPLTSYLKYV